LLKSVARKIRVFALAAAASAYNSNWFLSRAADAGDRSRRSKLLRKFRETDKALGSAHTEREMLVMADFLLTSATPGTMVECGCFKGGSSAKLSLVAAETGRKLIVCDSFQGLPAVGEDDGSFSMVATGERHRFVEGEYAAGIDLVRENITRWGDISVCSFVPGFFSDSLPHLKVQAAFIFADADLIQSTRDVLRSLWHSLEPGGRFYSHDMHHTEFVLAVMDPDFWMREIGEPPPVLFGAGYGCGWGARGIAFAIKPPRSKEA
jgi:O-methyltransferase